MVILKSLKKQLHQFVTPEFETLVEDTAALVQSKRQTELPASSAYSHGLENIYALENVDPKTIRKFGGEEEKADTKQKTKPIKSYAHLPASQTELNLGPKYVSTMPSLALNLPLNALRVGENTLKAASQKGLLYIKDLVNCDWEELILKKGLGQGLAEELRNAFNLAFGDKELLHSQTVDLRSLLRCLIPQDMLVKHFVLYKEYGLEEVIELTPVMQLELKRAPKEVKDRWLEESLSALKSVDCVELIESCIQRVVQTFVVPWLYQRNGFAYIYEVMDRLEQICEEPRLFGRSLNFLSSNYCEGRSVIQRLLPIYEDQVVFADEFVRKQFAQVEQRALSYFYKPTIEYSMNELVTWIHREAAASWEEVHAQDIEKVLTHSPIFHVHKNVKNEIIVTLA